MENREIKFRAWDTIEKRMCNVLSINWDENLLYWRIESGLKDWYPIDSFILLQYTGLKDKNFIEIYEGDIVKGNRTPDNFYNINIKPPYFDFREVKFMIDNHSISINLPSEISYSERTNPIQWKVIGNIYENPQLIENEQHIQ